VLDLVCSGLLVFALGCSGFFQHALGYSGLFGLAPVLFFFFFFFCFFTPACACLPWLAHGSCFPVPRYVRFAG
jgi:hypothetical protein